MNAVNVAAVSTGKSIANVAQGVSMSVMKKGMDSQEKLASNLIHKMMPPTPGKGKYIDMYV